jgi:hypothetical protein
VLLLLLLLLLLVQELAISLMHDNVDALWESYEAKYKKVLGPNVSPRNITYGMGVVSCTALAQV